MNVNVHGAIEILGQAEVMRTAADVGESRLRGLLHNVAELAGQRELALAVEHLNFGRENAASHFGPCKPGD